MARLEAGSYRGNAEGLTFDIRISRADDDAGPKLSGDITRDGEFVSSFLCIAPQEDEAGILSGEVRFRGHPELVTGRIRMEADDRGIGSFSLGVDLEGNYRDNFAGRLERLGSFMRRLTIEIDGIEGTVPPSTAGYAGRDGRMTIARAFERAGFDTTVRVDPFRTPTPDAGTRMRGYSLAEIHSAMEELKQSPQSHGLHVHVFVCSFLAGRDGRGVLGVMYDFDRNDRNRRPREGVAVFYDHPYLSDPRMPDDTRQREYVFTLVHEIGHALNLLHSFDKARPSALSWLNYPDLYPRGHDAEEGYDGTAEFWRRFPETFDVEEIDHLHHASPREIAAGGFAFGHYEDGVSRPFGGTSEPRLTRPGGNPLRAIGNVHLHVEGLKREYSLGEPVFVRTWVTNRSGRTTRVPDALDPVDGYVRLTFRSPSGRIIPYRPPVTFCRQAQLAYLPHNQSTHTFDGSPVFLSASGPVFTETGDYLLTAEMTGLDGSRVIYSRPSVIRIKPPDRTTEDFAHQLWEKTPKALNAMYLRHPLVAYDDWQKLTDRPLPQASDNTTASFIQYVSAMGWSEPFAPGRGRREYEPRRDKAVEHFRKLDPTGLPSSVARRKQACLEAPSSERRVFVTRTVAETLREQIAPAGLFGRIGLDDPKSRQRREFSPFERIVPNLQGSTRFADIVSWNIEHLHARSKWDRMPKIAELIRNFRCDFWGLQEVDDASLQELVKVVNSGGRLRYAHFSRPERGQQCGALYRTDTTRVSVIKPSANIEKAFGSTMQVSLRKGEKATRKVFERPPLLLDVRVVQASSQVFDFRCAIVHLKSTDTKIKDTGSGLRAKAGQILAQWIAEDRESGIETDYLIFGDMNAETAQQGLRAFAKKNDLNLLSVGMQDKYGADQALTRVASKRLLDHIVVTAGSVPLMPKEDISEQIIIRADADIAGWTSEMSDHVPVAVRFVLGEDKDPAPRRRR